MDDELSFDPVTLSQDINTYGLMRTGSKEEKSRFEIHLGYGIRKIIRWERGRRRDLFSKLIQLVKR